MVLSRLLHSNPARPPGLPITTPLMPECEGKPQPKTPKVHISTRIPIQYSFQYSMYDGMVLYSMVSYT